MKFKITILQSHKRDPMLRELHSHKVNGLNEALKTEVLDEPGPGSACHRYRIAVENGTEVSRGVCCDIEFQNGPIQEVGINGISNEALIAIVEDRLLGFQSGNYNCRENAIALTHLQTARMWLQKRTHDRMQRGVEGTNVP